jgi:ABC-type multidrug transport system fused ATPase/permease subunit
VVQAALDQAREGRTCIIIAHRLATVQHADMICVLNRGVVAEMGSHAQLLEKQGLYCQLLQQAANT